MMNSYSRLIVGVTVSGSIWLAAAGHLMAQGNTGDTEQRGWSARSDWQQRVLQHRRIANSGPERAVADQQRIAQRSPNRRAPVRTVSTTQEVVDLGDEQMQLTPSPADNTFEQIGPGVPETYGSEPGCSDCVDDSGCYVDGAGCGGCEACYGGCGLGLYGLRHAWWARDLSLHAGAHGFKGPLDQGRNGNFGLHEGVNFGAPLGGPWDWGYQVGFTAVHSNFSGDRADNDQYRRGDRDQFFLTAGIFRRALCGGFQGGVAFDLLRDSYYVRADLKQLRTELGYVFPGGRREIGYWGAYGVGEEDFTLNQNNVLLKPTDIYAFYVRRYFEGGGEGRLWAGFSGEGDGLLGADLCVPLGGNWALENRVNYLIPEQGRGDGGQAEESWGLTIRLVWYLGQPAHCAQTSPFRPLLPVADNSLFMSDVF